jgi:NADPH2:quinone reductase
MRAVVYSEAGGPEVLRLVERDEPQPGPGEVRVVIAVSGINPTDWKARRSGLAFPEIVPNQDGAGTIDAVGEDVDPGRIGERVWVWEASWQRPDGTAQEKVALPSRQAVRLPHDASFDLGASLGIPALTAHRCLTVAEGGPSRLGPGALAGRTVLVAGGAGAVGHATIQLARWSSARVLATASSKEKAALAEAAGAELTVNYRDADPADLIREAAPDGVDVVTEVAPATNAQLDAAILAPSGTVAAYAAEEANIELVARPLMTLNIRYQFVLVYTIPAAVKDAAVEDVTAAVAAGALPVGSEAGLPLQRFPFERTADAHATVEAGAVGKVLVDVAAS